MLIRRSSRRRVRLRCCVAASLSASGFIWWNFVSPKEHRAGEGRLEAGRIPCPERERGVHSASRGKRQGACY
jgi:hypothetical protein